MKQQDLLAAYRTFDALLFPSLHDSSGNVVLESLAGGLPVVCLDLGGPAQLVDASCGVKVSVDDRDADQVILALADALTELAQDRMHLDALRTGAVKRAQAMGWQQVVGQVWGENGSGYWLLNNRTSEDQAYA